MKKRKQTSKIKRVALALICLTLVLGWMSSNFSVVAATNKILVSDNDGDNAISIGDKFCIGEECFYVTKNANGKISALAEYNLYVGANYSKIVLDINNTFIRYRCKTEDVSSCYTNVAYYFDGQEIDGYYEWEKMIFDKYGDNFISTEVYGDVYVWNNLLFRNMTYKLYPYIEITEETEGYALQNELARGVNGEKGNATYPIYATVRIHENRKDSADIYKKGYMNFDLVNDSYLMKVFSEYETILSDSGYVVDSVDMFNIEDVEELVYAISGKELPLIDWYDESLKTEQIGDDDEKYVRLGDLTQYLSNSYAWIWNTTYWLKTAVGTSLKDYDYWNTPTYFISTAGDLCYADSCRNSIPRAGVRPVITMTANQFELNRIDINGTINWMDNGDASKRRPLKAMIRLYRNGIEIDNVAATKGDANDLWHFAFTNLPKFDAKGELYTYTISQDDIADYDSMITSFDIVNEYNSGPVNPSTDVGNPTKYAWLIVAISIGVVGLARKSRR